MGTESTNLSSRRAARLLERIGALTGISDSDARRRLVKAVTGALAEQLPKADRAWLGQVLPAGLYEAPADSAAAPAPGLLALKDRVAAASGVTLPTALEHAQCVCCALAEVLEPDQLAHLIHRVPDDCVELFEEEDSESAPVDEGRAIGTRRRRTLAEGKPGSEHALATAVPPTRAQPESVARSSNPHGDTKLSSTEGTTQEREEKTIARARRPARGRR